MTASLHISPFQAWMLAIRPRTLPAAVAPVVVGTGLAISQGGFRLFPALAALSGALLLQIAVNLANDYFDCVKGVDGPGRLGPIRVTESGLIAPKHIKAAMITVFGCSAATGLYLIMVAGWPVLAMGLASILAAVAYSGGPYPLASHGLGDISVFIFFGLVAVCGTYYVQTLHLTALAVSAAIPVGLLITAILVVNNLRDIPTDRRAGKRTLAVILGRRGSRIEYLFLLVGAYAMPIGLWLSGSASKWVLLSLASLPMALPLIRVVWAGKGLELNQALAGTARLAFVYSLLLSLGLIPPL
jgi:1,4-dihydroxy-2-naphthoate octaprenyltransferase